MKRLVRWLALVLIVAGCLAGLWVGKIRTGVERRNRAVEIAVDSVEVERLALSCGVPQAQVLARLKGAGATSVAVDEITLADVVTDGAATASSGPDGPSLRFNSSGVYDQVVPALRRRGVRMGDVGTGPSTLFLCAGRPALKVAGAMRELGLYGVGLPAGSLALASAAGLGRIARVGNFPGCSPQTMPAMLGEIRSQGIGTVIFSGLEVLGFRTAIREAAEAIELIGLTYGSVEFGKQKGDEPLSTALHGRLVRVHSVSDGEMGQLSEADLVERFVRASRERNIRVCYVRLLTYSGSDALQQNCVYLNKIVRGVTGRGDLAARPAHPFDEPAVPRVLPIVVAMGVASALYLVLSVITGISAAQGAALLALLVVALGGLVAVSPEGMGAKLAALAAAICLPTLACLVGEVLDDRRPTPASISASAITAIKAMARMSAVTLVGAVSVVGLLWSRVYMVHAEQFAGIKAAHAIPVVLIALLMVVGLPGVLGRDERRRRMASLMDTPLKLGMLLTGAVALVVIAFALARTGNDPGVGVSGVELRLRSLLDALLVVRPRTKEFMIGHPAMLMALAFWFRGRARVARPLFVLGVLGQVSLLNTFCHIHTTLLLSVIRGLLGLGLGAVIGLALYWVTETLLSRSDRKVAGEAG